MRIEITLTKRFFIALAAVLGLSLILVAGAAVGSPTILGRLLRLERGTTAARPTAAAINSGALYFATDDTSCGANGSPQYSDGTAWAPFCGIGGSTAPVQFWRDAGTTDITPSTASAATSVIIPGTEFDDAGIQTTFNLPLEVFSPRDSTSAPHGAALFASGGFLDTQSPGTTGTVVVATRVNGTGQVASIAFTDTTNAQSLGGIYATGGGGSTLNLYGGTIYPPSLGLAHIGGSVYLNAANLTSELPNLVASPFVPGVILPKATTGTNAIDVPNFGRASFGTSFGSNAFLVGDGTNLFSLGGVFDATPRPVHTLYVNGLVTNGDFGGFKVPHEVPAIIIDSINGYVRQQGTAGKTVNLEFSDGLSTCLFELPCDLTETAFNISNVDPIDCHFNANAEVTATMTTNGCVDLDIIGNITIQALYNNGTAP